MKVKFNHTDGAVIYTLSDNDVSLDRAVELLKSPSVISITVTKQTSAQYLKAHRALKAIEETDG